MARAINDRLVNLRARRTGLDRLDRFQANAREELLRDSLIQESWQSRTAASGKPYTRYALGAMQEVGAKYTRISVETAERVGKQLAQDLPSAGFSVEFRLQGSVPLNVHIRGVSDVDLLTLDTSFLTYDSTGVGRQLGYYTSPTNKNSYDVIVDLRGESAKILRNRFPAATVDDTGGKAICISGGSLARSVDVVPSHWHDNAQYQRTREESDRSVTIADRKERKTIKNLPFLHIRRVHEADLACNAGLKKAIRLCKNVKADADGTIALPSFDIAGMMWHADRTVLGLNARYELAVLGEAQRFLDYLTKNETYAKTLVVPDGSRYIFDSREKLDALRKLSIEMDQLTLDVAKEQSYLSSMSLDDSRKTVNESVLPTF